MPKKLTTEEFIRRARKTHGDKYNYSKVVYKFSGDKVCIVCPEHGDFYQRPSMHIKGNKCPKCALEERTKKRTSNKEQFVASARLIHGNKYDYSKVAYVNNNTKVCIICPLHGEFLQRPADHLNGCGCSACAGNKKLTTQEFIENAKKVHGDKFDYTGVKYKGAHIPITIVCKDCGAIIKTTPHNHVVGGGCVNCRIIEHTRTKESFIEQARKVHGDKYNYDNVEYVHGETKVKIKCGKHGYFIQTPNSHIQGSGCPECAKEEMIRKATMTKEEFVAKAIAVHGNKYDYTDTVYNGVRNKIRIWCNQHKGYFEQCAATHLKGEGCQVCGGVYQPTTEEYIEMCKKVHGDKYIYDKTIYKNRNSCVWIKCDKHGYFQQRAGSHLSGCGCPDCGRDSQKEKMRYSREKFIEKAKLTHPTENYDYSLVEYVNSYTPIKIICPRHGVFEQTPSCHLSGCGCQSCQRSMGELKIIEFLDKHGVSYEKQHKIKNEDLFCLTKTFLCDFYIKDKNTIIEYNGQQHYRPSLFFGGVNSFEKQQDRDISLRLYCKEHKIKLIEIPYTEFGNIENILKKKLKL